MTQLSDIILWNPRVLFIYCSAVLRPVGSVIVAPERIGGVHRRILCDSSRLI